MLISAVQQWFSYMLVAQLCLTLCDPMDCSPPGFSVLGILQAKIQEWVAMPSSRESSWPRNQTQISCIASGLFTIWATGQVCVIQLQLHMKCTLPLWFIPGYWPYLPVLRSRSLVLIHTACNSLHPRIPISRFVPPPPFFPGQPQVRFLCLRLFCR